MNEIEPALRRAYALGQKYWQQADSDFARDHRKADETQAKFNQLVESMQGWLSPAEADNLRAQLVETQDALQAAQRLFKEALPKFNWGASFLDANAIQLLNEVPAKVNAAIDAAKGGSNA